MNGAEVPSGLEAEVLLIIDELHDNNAEVTLESVASAFSPVTPEDVRVAVERLREQGYVTELATPRLDRVTPEVSRLEPTRGKGTEAVRQLREAG
jgi:hypothetical protein